MRNVIAGAALVFVAGGALAQTASPPASSSPGTPAIARPSTPAPGAPVAGANSFTEGQAKSRIEAAGYTGVSGLAKDKDGVWRGKGMKSGTAVDVSLDYQGNVSPK